MFTREQQQYFNQSWSAWQKLKDFLKKSVSGRSDTSGTETLCRRSDLQIQGVLTEMALSAGGKLSDEEQMFIRSLAENADLLRADTPGYGKYFLDINRETYDALKDSMGKEAQRPLLPLQAAVRQAKEGDRRCVDAVMTQLLVITNSYLLLTLDPDGSKSRYLADYIGKTLRYLQKEGTPCSEEVEKLARQTIEGKHAGTAVRADQLAGSGSDQNGPKDGNSSLDALTAMINDNLNTMKELSKIEGMDGRMQNTLSSLVGDLFGGGSGNAGPGSGPFGGNTGNGNTGSDSGQSGGGSNAGNGNSGANSGQPGGSNAGNGNTGANNGLPGQDHPDMQSVWNPNLVSAGAANGNSGAPRPAGSGQTAETPEAEAAVDFESEDAQERIDAILEELNQLIGLATVKEDVKSLINVQKVNLKRKHLGMKEADVSKHLVFSGNPGTGKTTVARILAKVYHELGLLSQGQLVEVDRAGLVAGYIGQTAIKTKEVIDSAMGGILFVDEAYTLSANKGEGDFGQEAIDTILKAMEDHRDEFIVIVAGYTDLMEEFLDSNPGLRSRFNKFIFFPDYTPDELTSIFAFTAKKNGYTVSADAMEYLKNYYTVKTALGEPNFANARDARNLFEKAITRQANRLADKEECTKEELEEITLRDLTGDDVSAVQVNLSGEAGEMPEAAKESGEAGVAPEAAEESGEAGAAPDGAKESSEEPEAAEGRDEGSEAPEENCETGETSDAVGENVETEEASEEA